MNDLSDEELALLEAEAGYWINLAEDDEPAPELPC